MKTKECVSIFLVHYGFNLLLVKFKDALLTGPVWFLAQINAIVLRFILFYQRWSFSQFTTHPHATILFEAKKLFVLFLLLVPFSTFNILPICLPIVLGNNSASWQFLRPCGFIQKSFDFGPSTDLVNLHILTWVTQIHFLISLPPLQRDSLLLRATF